MALEIVFHLLQRVQFLTVLMLIQVDDEHVSWLGASVGIEEASTKRIGGLSVLSWTIVLEVEFLEKLEA